jgi:hypothetical protein
VSRERHIGGDVQYRVYTQVIRCVKMTSCRRSASRLPALADAVPRYIEAVTLLVDDDKDGRRHASALCKRLIVRGKEVRLALAGNSARAAA